MKEPLLTIIVPIFNVEKYLNRCIKSIVNQSYTNLEIILVDDGSTDNSKNICDRWAQNDRRIKVLHKKNGGLSDARNSGLKISNGEIITFVDSDDYIMLDMYKQMISALEETDADIAVCGDFFVDEDENILSTENVNELETLQVYNKTEALNILCRDKYIVSHAWDKIYKRQVIIDERFPENHNYEDIYIMHRIFLNASKVVHINQPKYFYIQRKGSIVKTPSLNNQMDLLNAYICRYKDLESIVCDDVKWCQLNILIEVLSVCTQRYSSKKFKKIIKFIDNNLDEFSNKYKIPFKRKIKFICSKYDINLYVQPTKIKNNIKKSIVNNLVIKYKEKKLYKKNKKQIEVGDVYLLGVPEYGNLGDQIIAEAEINFLQDVFGSKKIVQVRENDLKYNFCDIRKIIKNKNLIVMQGGGNLGDIWPDQEEIRKKIIKTFKKNKIVIMPQTISIKDENKSLKKVLSLYNRKNIWLMLRDRKSKSISEKIKLENDTLLIPDIALYLPTLDNNYIRRGIGICLRQDIETNLGVHNKIKILYELSAVDEVWCFDTVINERISIDERKKYIEKMLKYLSQFEIIITDRLHCMIMAYLTGTPCIVFANSTGKVLGVYEWIKDSNCIMMCNSKEELQGCIEKMRRCVQKKEKSFKFDRDNYDKLQILIQNLFIQ